MQPPLRRRQLFFSSSHSPYVERPLAFGVASVVAGALSWATLFAPGGTWSHLAENVTWGLVVAAFVCALLASDGARGDRLVRPLIAGGIVLAAARALFLFVPVP